MNSVTSTATLGHRNDSDRALVLEPDLIEASVIPRLSIVTVTYNAEDTLENTLLSIFNQTFTDYEVIVVDGKSSDATGEIIKNYFDKIARTVSEKDNGIYDAMNKGLSMARGEYIQFLNAGDYFSDNSVLREIFSHVNDSPVLIYGDINIVSEKAKSAYQVAGEFTRNHLLKRGTGVLCHQAMFVRKSMAPFYNCKYKYKAELNWYFDILDLAEFTSLHVSYPVVNYSLGGFGHKNHIRNRIEWVRLIYNRFGMAVLLESRIIIFLLKGSIARYRILNDISKFIRQTRQAIRYFLTRSLRFIRRTLRFIRRTLRNYLN